MAKIMFTLFILFSSVSHGQECPQDPEITQIMSPCQMAYYKFAPECRFGDVSCLSLVLHGLVNKDLFDYRSDIRRVYNTPLKRKRYSRTSEYRKQYRDMLEDLTEVKSATFCAEMENYWLYDLGLKGFPFSPNTIIPKGNLFRLNNIERIRAGYDLVKVREQDAVDIESWETIGNAKYVFFKVVGSRKGYVGVDVVQFVWLIPRVQYDHEGNIDITYDEGCQNPSYYEYKADK